jgi:hypothetical protein
MRKFLLILVLLSACAKEPPNLSPITHSQFIADRYIKALDDLNNGLEIAFKAGKLSKENTQIAAQIIQVALITIHDSPNGAKSSALTAIANIRLKVSAGELVKFTPYLDAARTVIEGLN